MIMNLILLCMYFPVVATSGTSNRLFSSRSPPSQQQLIVAQQQQHQQGNTGTSTRRLGFVDQHLPPLLGGGGGRASSSPTATSATARTGSEQEGRGNGLFSSITSKQKRGESSSFSSLKAAAVVVGATGVEDDHGEAGTAAGVGVGAGGFLHPGRKLLGNINTSVMRGGTTAAATATNERNKLGDLLTTHRKKLSLAVVAIAILAGVYRYRDVLLNKEKIQDEALRLLRSLNNEDTSLSQSLSMYACGMAVWEFFGLSTIPVETAAGMVFGWPGAIASLSGKLIGAVASFSVGRGLFAQKAQEKLLHYKLFQQLLSQQEDTQRQQQKNSKKKAKKGVGGTAYAYAAVSTTSTNTSNNNIRWQSHPITTSFLMKFSCFPELVKNVGTSLLSSVNVPTFVFATLVHGGIFTLLWTWWGVEYATRMGNPTHMIPKLLQLALVGAAVLGVVISPSLMAWWIRDLQLTANEKKK